LDGHRILGRAPDVRGCKRAMTLTAELVALCSRAEPEAAPNASFTPLTDAEREELAQRLVRDSSGQDLWLFAYGSLIWKPAFEFVASHRGAITGWHRSFCLEMTGWRATPEQPGLMLALERGGSCHGVAYRLPGEDRPAQIHRLLARELEYREDLAGVRWVTVRTDRGPVRALLFWAGVTGPGISSRLPLDTVAGILARACGHMGSCAEYLYNTVRHLEELGIRDRNLWRLQELVAAEIKAIHGLDA